MTNAAGFQYFGGPYVTVLSSKTSQRYRLQSDNLASLWLLTQSLENRLNKKFAGDTKVPLECSYSSSLPMHEYYSEIELHFHKRKKLITLQVGQFCSYFLSYFRWLNGYIFCPLIYFEISTHVLATKTYKDFFLILCFNILIGISAIVDHSTLNCDKHEPFSPIKEFKVDD